MRKSCDVTDVVKTLRKHTEACRIDLMNFDWNQSAIPAGINGFTECFDGVVTSHDFLIEAQKVKTVTFSPFPGCEEEDSQNHNGLIF